MPQRPKKLLDPVRARPELVKGMQFLSSSMPIAPRRHRSTRPSDLFSITANAIRWNWERRKSARRCLHVGLFLLFEVIDKT
jgi:hypothetical protein